MTYLNIGGIQCPDLGEIYDIAAVQAGTDGGAVRTGMVLSLGFSTEFFISNFDSRHNVISTRDSTTTNLPRRGGAAGEERDMLPRPGSVPRLRISWLTQW